MIPGPATDDPAAEAAVPEQVAAYVCTVGGARPCRLGACVGYRSDGHLVLVGYPLHDPRDRNRPGRGGERRPSSSPGSPHHRHRTGTPPAGSGRRSRPATSMIRTAGAATGPVRQKLRNLMRSASRELTIERGRQRGADHLALVDRYEGAPVYNGTRYIFRRMPDYLRASRPHGCCRPARRR